MKTLVFLHGLFGSKNNFIYLEKELSKDFNTLPLDFIGYGRAKKPQLRYDSDTFVSFLEGVLDLSQKYVLVGHSLGAIIAKDFTLKHPDSVEKVFLIGYPTSSKNQLKEQIFHAQHPSLAEFFCRTEVFWNHFFFPYVYLFHRKYVLSFKDYFRHTHHSQIFTIRNTLLKDDLNTLKGVREKAIFIIGEHDKYIDKELSFSGKEYLIRGMGHPFFHYEKEIAGIIRKELKG